MSPDTAPQWLSPSQTFCQQLLLRGQLMPTGWGHADATAPARQEGSSTRRPEDMWSPKEHLPVAPHWLTCLLPARAGSASIRPDRPIRGPAAQVPDPRQPAHVSPYRSRVTCSCRPCRCLSPLYKCTMEFGKMGHMPTGLEPQPCALPQDSGPEPRCCCGVFRAQGVRQSPTRNLKSSSLSPPGVPSLPAVF